MIIPQREYKGTQQSKRVPDEGSQGHVAMLCNVKA